MNKEKLIENLELRIEYCKKDMDRIATYIRRNEKDWKGDYINGANYDEQYAAVVGSLDAYMALLDLIKEGEFD